MKNSNLLITFLALVFFTHIIFAKQILISNKTSSPPEIDGIGSDKVWEQAQVIKTFDKLLPKSEIEVSSLYDDESIYFKVTFPDATENREHKTMKWDVNKKRYVNSSKREDVFIFKWNMAQNSTIDISLDSNYEYIADIWYWKAHRTDHANAADDKYQKYQSFPVKRATKIINSHGNIFYLLRHGDNGKPAYKAQFIINKEKDWMPRFKFNPPKGSRADIVAKGVWNDGLWTIEFKRKLNTEHNDDVQFDITEDNEYAFGVSLFEIAGRKPDPTLEKPDFGSGDISELLLLKFEK